MAFHSRLLGVKTDYDDAFKQADADLLALAHVLVVIRGYDSSSGCAVFLLHANFELRCSV